MEMDLKRDVKRDTQNATKNSVFSSTVPFGGKFELTEMQRIFVSVPHGFEQVEDRLIIKRIEAADSSSTAKKWELALKNLRTGKPSALHRDLEEVRDESSAVGFANTWGNLGLAQEFDQTTTQTGERFSKWINEGFLMRSSIRLWEFLRNREDRDIFATWPFRFEDIYKPSDPDYPEIIRHLFTPEQQASLGKYAADCDNDIQRAASEFIEFQVGSHLKSISLGISIERKNGIPYPQKVFAPATTLLEAAWMSFFLELTGEGMELCPRGCGTWFTPGPRQTTCGSETCRKAFYRRQHKRINRRPQYRPGCDQKFPEKVPAGAINEQNGLRREPF